MSFVLDRIFLTSHFPPCACRHLCEISSFSPCTEWQSESLRTPFGETCAKLNKNEIQWVGFESHILFLACPQIEYSSKLSSLSRVAIMLTQQELTQLYLLSEIRVTMSVTRSPCYMYHDWYTHGMLHCGLFWGWPPAHTLSNPQGHHCAAWPGLVLKCICLGLIV